MSYQQANTVCTADSLLFSQSVNDALHFFHSTFFPMELIYKVSVLLDNQLLVNSTHIHTMQTLEYIKFKCYCGLAVAGHQAKVHEADHNPQSGDC